MKKRRKKKTASGGKQSRDKKFLEIDKMIEYLNKHLIYSDK